MINLPDSMRPGVYTSTDIRIGTAAAGTRAAIAAVGQAKAGYEPAGTAVEVRSYTDASAFGEESTLCAMARALLAGGVSRVLAVAVGADYEAAFAALEGERDLFAVVSDGGGAALARHVDACCAMGRERVGIVAAAEAEAAVAAAAEINNTRVAVTLQMDGDTVDFHALDGFNVVIVRPGSKIIYSDCRWSAIDESTPLGDLVYETLTLVARTRMEVQT